MALKIVKTDTGVFPGPSRTIAQMTTRADGSYTGSLPGAHIAGTETDADWIITASRPAGRGEVERASSSFELEVNTAVHGAPGLPLWESTPAVGIDGYRVHVPVPGASPAGMDPQVVVGRAAVNASSWVKPSSVATGSPQEDGMLIARFEPVNGARFVRVSRPGGSLAPSEISAWPARPPGSPVPATTSPRPSPRPGLRRRSPPLKVAAPAPRRPVGPPLLAAFLRGGVAAALAATRARRLP